MTVLKYDTNNGPCYTEQVKKNNLLADLREIKEGVEHLLADLDSVADAGFGDMRKNLRFCKSTVEERAAELARKGDVVSAELAEGFERALDDLREAGAEVRTILKKDS